MSARDYDEDIDLSDMPYADDDGIMHWPNATPDEREPTEAEMAEVRQERERREHEHQQQFDNYRVPGTDGQFVCAHCDRMNHEAFMHECEDCGFMVGNDCHAGECPAVGAVVRMGADDVDLINPDEVL